MQVEVRHGINLGVVGVALVAIIHGQALFVRPASAADAVAPGLVIDSGALPPSQSGVLTIDDALYEAYRANPVLAAVIAQRPVAQAGLVQAKLRINPTYNNQFAPEEATYHFVDIKTTTQLGFKRQRRIEVAQRLIDSTDATIRTMTWKIRQDTEAAFFELTVARQTLIVMQSYLDVTKRLFTIAQQRQQSRDASGLEVLRADAAVADAKTQLAPVMVRVQQAERQLNIVLGRLTEQPLQISPPAFLNLDHLPHQLPQFDQLVIIAEQYRPEYKQNSADLAVQQAKVKLARSARWPDVQIGMGISSVPQSPNVHYWGSHIKQKPFLYAQIPITVFDYGQGSEALARSTFSQLQVQRKALTNQVRQELNTWYSAAQGADQQLRIFIEETLPKQARVVVLTEKGYGAGVIDLTGAITAQQAALGARLGFLQASTRYFQALVELERATGRPLIGELTGGAQRP